jgi:PadR family transcriptional regulator PadR
MKMRKGNCAKFGFKMSNILYAVFLYLLMDNSASGYKLNEELAKVGIDPESVPTGINYRLLRDMEASGLLVSKWETSGSGPAKRVYKITDAGKEYLKSWLIDAKRNLKTMQNLIDLIEKRLQDIEKGLQDEQNK